MLYVVPASLCRRREGGEEKWGERGEKRGELRRRPEGKEGEEEEEKRSRRRESGEGKKEEKKEEEERTRECNPSGTGPGSEKVRAEPPGRTRRAEKPGLSKTALVRKMAGPPRLFFLCWLGCVGGADWAARAGGGAVSPAWLSPFSLPRSMSPARRDGATGGGEGVSPGALGSLLSPSPAKNGGEGKRRGKERGRGRGA